MADLFSNNENYEKSIPLLAETEKIASQKLANGGYVVLYESDSTATMPLNVFKVLKSERPAIYSNLMSCLKDKGKLNRDNNNPNLSKTCLVSSNQRYFVSRFCLIDTQYATIKSDDEKRRWSSGEDALEFNGHKYHFYLSYEAHDKNGSSDLRINDFAMTLYTITNGECFISFTKTEKSTNRYTMRLHSKIQFSFFKLGKFAIPECKLLDSRPAGLLNEILTVKLRLSNSKFPKEWELGNYVFLWLGSDNNLGTPTSWKQGIKALAKSSSMPYQDGDSECVEVEVLYIFPEAINILSLLKDAPTAYYWCCSMPFINPMDHANQSARLVRDIELSDPKAFFYALSIIDSNFQNSIIKKEPELEQFFDYEPLNPSAKSTQGRNNDIKAQLPLQLIYFGAPGTSKSTTIKRETEDKGKEVYRVTFHPDTDYSNFVGCYKPAQKENSDQITYRFVAQPFTHAYVSAWKKLVDANEQNKDVFLVIEEINRGNCAQIFGDLFQLLDRREDGYSDYTIEPDSDLQDYLRKKFAGSNVPAEIKSGKKMQLPPNFYIWATMNTSDQSLFPIDSAFKRRWDWRYTPITKPAGKNHKIRIEKTDYDWWKFLENVNERIEALTESEDKQLGYWFARPKEGEVIDVETFVGKVVFYLWNDIFKDFGDDERSVFMVRKADDKERREKITFRKFFDKVTGEIDTNIVKRFLESLGLEGTEVKENKPEEAPEAPEVPATPVTQEAPEVPATPVTQEEPETPDASEDGATNNTEAELQENEKPVAVPHVKSAPVGNITTSVQEAEESEEELF